MPLSFDYKLLVDPKTGRCAQSEFINITKRHSCFSGGYGNGKSYAASIKALILLTTFPKYRIAICRYSATDLKRSTMSTFFKVCPPELYDPSKGGNRADSMNYLRLINGSEVFWMHLDDADEKTVRGLEINSFIIDQAEEISENMYDHLKARLGRWEIAEVPDHLLDAEWPRNPETNRPICPSFAMNLCNPDAETHFLYKRFHPESIEHQEKFHRNYEMVQASSTENPSLDAETLADMMANDPIWVRRFVFGIWGIPGGAIHEINPTSILEIDPVGDGTFDEVRKCVLVPQAFYDLITRMGNNYRVLDHGDASPTCCLWITSWREYFFVRKEYYKPDALISAHRRTIDEMSKYPDGLPETYKNFWADPAMFKKSGQKYGGFWSEAEEYADKHIEAPPLYLQPADNNELATRNRLNEYFQLDNNILHPVNGKPGSPRFFFFRRNSLHPQGCSYAISETKSQKRKQLGTTEGKPIFCDERNDKIPDHAYDCVRYFGAMHPYWTKKKFGGRVSSGSFLEARNRAKAGKIMEREARQSVLGSY
jgi:hypothetical protein